MPRSGRLRITDAKTDSRIVKYVSGTQRTTLKIVKEELGLNISLSTIRRRVPFITEKNRIAKFECFNSKRRLSVWRKHREEYKKGLTQPTVKHSRYAMVCGCFAWSGVSNRVKITRKMDSIMYKGYRQRN